MFRRVVLSLTLLGSLLAILPYATSLAHNLRFQSAPAFRSHHSRAWWRRHRARLRRRQAMLARRKQLLSPLKTTDPIVEGSKSSDNHVNLAATISLPEGLSVSGSLPLPSGWSSASSRKGASTFRVTSAGGAPVGQATLSVVALTSPNANQMLGREQRRMLGGISFSDLRRSVIDRMLSAGGWVVNDRDREIGGHRVFQVIAQTPASGDGSAAQTWAFYFTEVNGRLYSLTAHSSEDFSDRLTTDAEKFLSSFHPGTNPSGANK